MGDREEQACSITRSCKVMLVSCGHKVSMNLLRTLESWLIKIRNFALIYPFTCGTMFLPICDYQLRDNQRCNLQLPKVQDYA